MRFPLGTPTALAALGAVVCLSCGHRGSTEIGAPVHSSDGIELAVASEDCACNDDKTDVVGKPALQIRIEVEVENRSGAPLHFQPSHLRLQGPKGVNPEPVAYGPEQTVRPGEDRLAQAKFAAAELWSCRDLLTLDPADSITTTATVPLPTITIRPQRSEPSCGRGVMGASY